MYLYKIGFSFNQVLTGPVCVSSVPLRFRMQVMLNGKLFPVAEASSKKVAKKDAAAAALRVLVEDMQGRSSTGENENPANMHQVLNLLPDTSVCWTLIYDNALFNFLSCSLLISGRQTAATNIWHLMISF